MIGNLKPNHLAAQGTSNLAPTRSVAVFACERKFNPRVFWFELVKPAAPSCRGELL